MSGHNYAHGYYNSINPQSSASTSSTSNSTPSLESVLQTLAAYTPTDPSTGQPSHRQQPLLEQGFNQFSTALSAAPPHHQTQHLSQSNPSKDHSNRSSRSPSYLAKAQPSSSSTSAPKTDPTLLTTYPVSLRYISHLLATNSAIQHRIAYLIREQHSHERQWFRGREELIKRIKSRKERQKQADDVLRRLREGREILGIPLGDGNVTGLESQEREEGEVAESEGKCSGENMNGNGKGGDDDQEDKEEEEMLRKELAVYDRKVWKAQGDMADAVEKELRNMGIPGFCLRDSLVRNKESKGLKNIVGEAEGDKEDRDAGSGQQSLSVEELVELKKKVAALLGDLCVEEW